MGPHDAAPPDRSPDVHTEIPCFPGANPDSRPAILVGGWWFESDVDDVDVPPPPPACCVRVRVPNTVALPLPPPPPPVSLRTTHTALQIPPPPPPPPDGADDDDAPPPPVMTLSLSLDAGDELLWRNSKTGDATLYDDDDRCALGASNERKKMWGRRTSSVRGSVIHYLLLLLALSLLYKIPRLSSSIIISCLCRRGLGPTDLQRHDLIGILRIRVCFPYSHWTTVLHMH